MTDYEKRHNELVDLITSVKQATERQFQHVEKRFIQLDERFDRVEVRLTSLETEMRAGFTGVNARLASLESTRKRRPGGPSTSSG